MNKEELKIIKDIIRIVIEVAHCEEKEVNENTRLSDIDYLDSLDHVEIFVKIERLYGVLIPDDECEKLSRKTIKEIADHVQAKIPV